MSDERGTCLTGAEITVLASASDGDEAAQQHVRQCAACREKLENLKFERQFAEALNAGARGGGSIPLPVLPGYEVLREVSRGGQGIVYEAIQQRTNRRVALKVLRQDHGVSRAQRARFDREIEIAAALKHPGIVGVYDSIGMPGGRHALVLEFVEGESLDRLKMAAGDAVERLRAAVELVAKVCDAIHYAHQRGVIHRDLKPSNIMVDQAGQPRVLDFGVACWFGAPGANASRITLTGEFAGTLAYAAPEQVSGITGAPDLRSDLYALGVILYQLCFGGLPYEVNGSLDSAIRNILATAPTRTRMGQGAGVDEDLWVIINKALAKEPDRRYQSAAAMSADLRRYLNGETIEARRDSRMYVLRKTMSRHRYAVGAVVAGFIGLGAFAVTVVLNNARLSEALRTSTFERARALGAAGSRPEADLLLWPEILRLGSALQNPALALFRGTPAERRVLWAFAEMQGAAPCLVSESATPGLRAGFACTNDRMVSVSRQGELEEWAIPDLRLIARRRIFAKTLLDMDVSIPGGVCVVFDRPDLVVIESSTGAELARTAFTGESRIGVKICGNGSRVAVSSTAKGVHVFDLPALLPVFQKSGVTDPHAPCLSETGDRVGIVFGNEEVAVYHLPDGARERSWSLADIHESATNDRPSIFQGLAICEQGNRAVAAAGHHLYVTQAGGQMEPAFLNVTVGSIAKPSISPSGKWLLTSADLDPLVKLWRTSDWTQVASYVGHFGQPTGALMTPDERFIVTVDTKIVFRVWPGPKAEAIRELPDSKVSSHDFAIDESDRTAWIAGSDGRVGRRSLDGKDPPQSVRADSKTVFSVALSAQIGVLAAAGHDGIVSIFRDDMSVLRTLDAIGSDGVSCVRFSPDGRQLAVCGRNGPVVLFDTSTWERASTIETDIGRIVMARWSPDGTAIAIAGADTNSVPGAPGFCESRDVLTGGLLKRWVADSKACRAVEFSPDGGVLATGGNDGKLRLLDAATWEPLHEVHINSSILFCLAFHPAGHVLAVGDRSGRVTVLGLPERRVLAHFDYGSSIMSIQFAGDQLIVAPLDLPVSVRDFGMIAGCVSGNMEFWKTTLAEHSVEGAAAAK